MTLPLEILIRDVRAAGFLVETMRQETAGGWTASLRSAAADAVFETAHGANANLALVAALDLAKAARPPSPVRPPSSDEDLIG